MAQNPLDEKVDQLKSEIIEKVDKMGVYKKSSCDCPQFGWDLVESWDAAMKHYFLFGQLAAKIYHNEGFDKLFEMQSDDQTSIEMALHVYDTEKHTPSELLLSFDGWGGFAEITEAEYIQFASQIL